MKKPINQIKPNPHRDFNIYPLGETQISLLMDSINDVGMFLGLPARKVGNFYELACGHHRLEAVTRTGATHIDLAVKDYSDDEMLKIMIRENSTQRGNENFGAVLDSVGAVLVQCVKDIYYGKNIYHNIQGSTPKQNVETGRGLGSDPIVSKEPSLSIGNINAALTTFRNTGTYLHLLKKGGLPEEYWHLYEKPQTSTIEAAAMFSKPAHAAEWMRQVDNDVFRERFPVSCHQAMVADIMGLDDSTVITCPLIRGYVNKKLNPNVNLTPDEKEEKTADDLAEELVSTIKSLSKKMAKFKEAIGVNDCYIENINPIITPLVKNLEWLMNQRNSNVIDI